MLPDHLVEGTWPQAGREGRTASALRVLVGALSRRRGVSTVLEILD